MKLAEKKIDEYLKMLGSELPAPGGGAAGALSGAQGAALGIMVVDLTLGKERYADFEENCHQYKEKMQPVMEELTVLIDKDAEAFNGFSKAMKMPKNTDEEKAARKDALAKASVEATEIPFRTMELCCLGIEHTKALVGQSNPNVVTDIGAAISCLIAGVKTSWLNVLINLPGIKDESKAEHFRNAGSAMLAKSETLAEEIYEAVVALV